MEDDLADRVAALIWSKWSTETTWETLKNASGKINNHNYDITMSQAHAVIELLLLTPRPNDE